MGRSSDRWFAVRQVAIVGAAVVAYFGVRGLTEGSVAVADRNGRSVLEIERQLGLDIELGLQSLLASSHLLVTLANWIYIWLHWPVLIGTLIWLLIHDRANYLWLRDAMIASGAIGLVLFATMPVTPPRLFAAYADTVTEYSHSYRVLQPPLFVNAYAAMPSLHFGWNLLAGVVWYRRSSTGWGRAAAVAMPAAMAFAVVATGNHWVLDVVIGGVVAGIGALLSSEWSLRQGATAPVTERTWPNSNCQRAPQPSQRNTTVAWDETSGANRSAEHRGQVSSGGSTPPTVSASTAPPPDAPGADGVTMSLMQPAWSRDADRSRAERPVDRRIDGRGAE